MYQLDCVTNDLGVKVHMCLSVHVCARVTNAMTSVSFFLEMTLLSFVCFQHSPLRPSGSRIFPSLPSLVIRFRSLIPLILLGCEGFPLCHLVLRVSECCADLEVSSARAPVGFLSCQFPQALQVRLRREKYSAVWHSRELTTLWGGNWQGF